MRFFYITVLSCLLTSCGGDSSSDETPIPDIPDPTPLVSFSISDAPSDSVTSVNVTFSSITLKSAIDNDDDASGLEFPILDEDGNPTTMTIDLMAYQNGDEKLIINNVAVPTGDYKSLVLNTSGCPQNQNGSTEFCWVVDGGGIKTLKTPSNKLKLGALSIATEAVQSYNIEFNLRSAMTNTAGGVSYNLKPHGIRIVNSIDVGSLTGTIDDNLLTVGEDCETVFQADSDHGKIIYLYEGEMALDGLMGDEYDPDVAKNIIPDGVIKPYASDSVSFNAESSTYEYKFTHLPAGNYTVALSCSAIDDDSEEYDGIMISNPSNQKHSIIIEANVKSEINFTES
jgi:hypothetical protein